MLYTIIIFAALFLLFFPFIPIGGDYYRSLLVIYHRYDLPILEGGWIFSIHIPMLEIVHGADPFTFKYIEADYAKDKRYVYTGQRLDNSDPQTFRVIDAPFKSEENKERYYVDKNSVRWGEVLQMKVVSEGKPAENFDAETFKPLGGHFIRDKTGVYFHGGGAENMSEKNRYDRYESRVDVYCRLKDIDAESFSITTLTSKKCCAKDKNFIYRVNHRWFGSSLTFKGHSKILYAIESIQPNKSD